MQHLFQRKPCAVIVLGLFLVALPMICDLLSAESGGLDKYNSSSARVPRTSNAPADPKSSDHSLLLDHIVVIVMENEGYENVIGNRSRAPFINRLASNFSIAANYFDVSDHRSLPNYLGMIAGNTYESWSTCNQSPPACKGWNPIPDRSIVDLLEEGGLTWKAYMEDMPSNCSQRDQGSYIARHDPFVYFTRVTNDAKECSRVVPAGPWDSNLISDLANSSSSPNFAWLTPNICNDMHDCPMSFGDNYLSHLIPQILDSKTFRDEKSALFLTWDEGYRSARHVAGIWACSLCKRNFTSNIPHSHYSLLSTIEKIWNLPSLTPNDRQAVAMTEFFTTPTLTLNYSPTSLLVRELITFTATATGGTVPYRYAWNFGDGSNATDPTIVHGYSTSGSYNVTLTITDASAHSDTKSTIVRVSDFTLNWAKQTFPLTVNSSLVSIITLGSLNGFSGNIVLTSNMKEASLNPSTVVVPVNGSKTATLAFTPRASGKFLVTVSASYGGLMHMINQTYEIPAQVVEQAPSILGMEPVRFYLMATTTGLVIMAGLFLKRPSRKQE